MQVLIRWAIQNGTSVIPKATGVSHIQGNLEALNFELSKEEFEVSCPCTPLPVALAPNGLLPLYLFCYVLGSTWSVCLGCLLVLC